jgi:hypothetical protein
MEDVLFAHNLEIGPTDLHFLNGLIQEATWFHSAVEQRWAKFRPSELPIQIPIFRLYRPIFFMDFNTLKFASLVQIEDLEAIQLLYRIKRYFCCWSIALKVRNPQYQLIQSLVSVEICLHNRKLSIGIGICMIP